MELRRRIGALLGVLGFILLTSGLAHAVSNLDLEVECVKDNGNGTFTADLGYNNAYRDDGYLVIAASTPTDNFFEPGEANRGQPTVFSYGRHPGEFKVTWDGTPTTWTVRYRIRGSEYETSVTLDSSDESQRLCRPVFYADCVMREYGRYPNGNWYESFDTYFSYFNPGESISVPEGGENRVTHSPWCEGDGCTSELSSDQPSTFSPGHHRGVFHADSRESEQYGNTSDVYWVIGDGMESRTTAVSQWSYTRECDVVPVASCLQTGCQVEGQKGAYTAWFGYTNSESFTVHAATPNYYNSLRQSYGCDYNSYNGYDQLGRACIYPQPTTFEPGEHTRSFGVCFSGNYNNQAEGATVAEGTPLDDIGLNNAGYVQWRLGSGWYDYSDSHYSMLTTQSKQCNRAPTCSTGNYSLPCTGVSTNVFLQGLLSRDPDGDTLAYEWKHTCANATLLGGDTLNPVLGMFSAGDCTVSLKVTEQGTADGFSATCSGNVSVSACTAQKDTQCQDRDMTSTEVLLATASDDQRKLIEREINFLRKVSPDRKLKGYLRTAHNLAQGNRTLAFTYPDVVSQCTNAANCSATSLSGITATYRATATQLDALANRLLRRVMSADKKTGEKYDKKRKEILNNLQVLYDGMPTSTNKCS